jgi:REP-associated tyrosine transposase
MSKGGYKIIDRGGMYNVSFTVVEWVDVFTRKEYRDIVVDSLKHCRENKGLESIGGIS